MKFDLERVLDLDLVPVLEPEQLEYDCPYRHQRHHRSFPSFYYPPRAASAPQNTVLELEPPASFGYHPW